MDMNGLEGDIEHLDGMRAAIEQLFLLQHKEGTRYYRDAPIKELRGSVEPMSAKALTFECHSVILQNAVFLLCQSLGDQSVLTKNLSKNIPSESIRSSNKPLNELVAVMTRINNTLRDFQVKKIGLKNQIGGGSKSEMKEILEDYEVMEEDVVFVLNHTPPKFMIKWIAHVVNVNIQPFKNEMHKLIGGYY